MAQRHCSLQRKEKYWKQTLSILFHIPILLMLFLEICNRKREPSQEDAVLRGAPSNESEDDERKQRDGPTLRLNPWYHSSGFSSSSLTTGRPKVATRRSTDSIHQIPGAVPQLLSDTPRLSCNLVWNHMPLSYGEHIPFTRSALHGRTIRGMLSRHHMKTKNSRGTQSGLAKCLAQALLDFVVE